MSCTTYNNRIEIVQGDDKTLYASVWSADVSVWTEWDGYLQAKKYLADTTLLIDTSVGCTDSSMWVFTIPGSDTLAINGGDYTYQFYVQHQTTGDVKTVIQDRINVIDAVRT